MTVDNGYVVARECEGDSVAVADTLGVLVVVVVGAVGATGSDTVVDPDSVLRMGRAAGVVNRVRGFGYEFRKRKSPPLAPSCPAPSWAEAASAGVYDR